MAITEKYVSSAGGGAHDGSTEADAYSWTEMVTAWNVPAAAGTRFNVKGAIAARTTNTDTITGDGTVTSPIIIRGYASTIGDGYLGRTSSNAALITTNFASVSYTTGSLVASGANFIIWECMSITSAASTSTLATGTNCVVTRCAVTNSSTNAAARAVNLAGGSSMIYNSDASLTGASGGSEAVLTTTSCFVIGNRISGGPAIGVKLFANGVTVTAENLIYSSVGIGVSTTFTAGPALIYGNTIVGGTGDGVDILTGTTTINYALNNIITDNGGYGIDGVSAANSIFVAHNRTRDNTAGAMNSATDWIAASTHNHVTTDTGGSATDFTNVAGQDWTLIGTSPARSVGHFPFRDIGALQHVDGPIGKANITQNIGTY